MTWFDVNRDGREDLVIGSGRGGRLAVFENQDGSTFEPVPGALFRRPVARDQMSVIGAIEKGAPALLSVASNYEDGVPRGPAVWSYAPGRRRPTPVLDGLGTVPGPLALGDMDGDGDLDVFLGGRPAPGRYPEPASSRGVSQRDGRARAGRRLQRLVERPGRDDSGCVDGPVRRRVSRTRRRFGLGPHSRFQQRSRRVPRDHRGDGPFGLFRTMDGIGLRRFQRRRRA